MTSGDHTRPPDETVHERTYRIRALAGSHGSIRLFGELEDVRPRGLSRSDPEPLVIHHMAIDLTVAVPSFEVLSCEPRMIAWPHEECPGITAAYQKLAGRSITRGFNRYVREQFGGPGGCTHISALLQAMAPAVMQAYYSANQYLDETARDHAATTPDASPGAATVSFHTGTCHVFAESGPMVRKLADGGALEPPLWARDRLARLGLRDDDWYERLQSPPPAPGK